MSDEFKLDAEAKSLLAAFREEEALPEPVRERVWARVDEDVHRPEAPDYVRGAVIALAVAAAGILALVGVDAFVAEPEDPKTPVQAPYEFERDSSARPTTERTVEVSPPRQRPTSPTPAIAPPTEETVETERTPQRSHRRPAVGATPQEEQPPDSLAAETKYLQQVQSALVDHDGPRALTLIAKWRLEFPDGVLTQERQALRAVSLCEAGQIDAGRKAAARFLGRFPRSALAERVRGACPGK